MWVPAEREGQVPVWSQPGIVQVVLRTVGDLSPFIVRRASIQFGMYLESINFLG